MTTPIADDPILGDDGYPHQSELQRIREWPVESGYRALMDYVCRRWQYADMGYWKQEGDRFRLATGGWSGNESLIGAMESNWLFQSLCAISWHHGGLYFYDVQEWSGPKGKATRKRDPATPLDEYGRVIGCDHVPDSPA